MSDVFYMIHGCGKGKPTKRHESEASAIAEATRLADLEGGRYYVLKVIGYTDRPIVPSAYVDLSKQGEVLQ